MDKMFNWISVLIGVAGGAFAWAFGAWDRLLCTLITLIILDYITGMLKGWYTKRLSSEIGFKGIIKKIVILVMVIAANVLQSVVGEDIMLREIVIMFFIANEGLSLLENCAEISGNNIPKKLKEVLLQLRGTENVDDTEKSDGN